MAKKFIINDGNFWLGDVEMHFELSKDHTKTRCGGWWHIDKEKKILYLYAESTDFGRASKEDIIMAFKEGLYSPSLTGYKVIYSTEMELSVAMVKGTIIIESIS